MATKVILPMLGQTMEEGTIIKWFKQEGDKVEKGEALLEVMTDKVNMEVESPEAGILRKIIAQPDETIPIMAPIAILGTADEPIDDLLANTSAAAPTPTQVVAKEEEDVLSAAPAPALSVEVPAPSPSRVFISPRARRLAHDSGITIEALAGRGTGPEGRVVENDVKAYIAEMASVKASPLAARIAADKGIDVREIVGSGPGGKVMRDDVLQACTPAPCPGIPAIEGQAIPFTGMRKMVADAVARSAQTAPHVTLTAEIDMTDAVKVRGQILSEFERKYGTRVSFTDFVIKAAARALLDHPIVNSSLQGNEIRISPIVNMGVAVALDGGLIVPVVKNADSRSLAEVSVELKRLVDKAKAGSLSTDEISGGTFTITNLGAYGIDVFNPIITPGQSAILGVCRIVEKPVVVERRIEVRSMMNLCLSFDHRVMDGAPAAQYLQRVKELLESPYQLLI